MAWWAWALAAALLLAVSATVKADSPPSFVPRRPSSLPWTTFTRSNSGLPGDAIAAVAVGPEGEVWVGTYGRGAARFDGAGWFPVAPGLGIDDTWVTALAVGPDGTAWLGTYGAGLSRLSGGTVGDRLPQWTTFNTGNSGLPNDWVAALTIAPDGAVWIGTYGGGVARFDGRGWQVFNRRKDGLASDWVTGIAVARDGQVWVGTRGEGLSRFRPTLPPPEAFAPEAEPPLIGVWDHITASDGLPDDFVNALAIGLADDVWVATDSGLAHFDGRTWKTFTRDDGLPDNHVHAVATGPDGQVWVGTPRGAARFDGQTWQPLTRERGLAHDYVESIAVDEMGNVWFGTLGGLTRLAAPTADYRFPTPESPISNLQSPARRLPVILVHGWTPPPGDTLESSAFRFMARWLSRDGFPVFYASGISPNQTLYANARRLREVINAVKQETGAQQVILIGHSMGGLNIRAYTETALYQGDVAAVFTLGSPHAGVYLWRDLLVREMTTGNTQPSTRELLPEHMALFNRANANSHRVPYYLLAGDIVRQEALEFLRFWPPNDGLITVWSAQALGGPAVHRVTTEDAHAWSKDTILLDLPSYLWPPRLYLSAIRPVLVGVAPGSPEFLEAPVELWELLGTHGNALELNDRPPAPENRTPLHFGDLDPKARVRIRLPVDTAQRARFTILWRWGTLGVQLFDPEDRLVEPNGDDVERFELETGTFANLTVIQVQEPLAGLWTLELDGSDLEEAARYLVYAALDGPVQLTVADPPAWAPPGSTVAVTATLTADDAPIPGAAVTARVTWPDNTSEIMVLHDDGAHADGGAGDGVYGNTTTVPAAPGYAPVTLEARGTWQEVPFERGATAVITAASTAGRLADEARFVEAPQPGVEVGVEISRPGDFGVSVTLVDGKGQEVLRTTLPARLGAGRRTVRVPLDPALVASRTGPFRVTRVLLLDLAGAATVADETG